MGLDGGRIQGGGLPGRTCSKVETEENNLGQRGPDRGGGGRHPRPRGQEGALPDQGA